MNLKLLWAGYFPLTHHEHIPWHVSQWGQNLLFGRHTPWVTPRHHHQVYQQLQHRWRHHALTVTPPTRLVPPAVYIYEILETIHIYISSLTLATSWPKRIDLSVYICVCVCVYIYIYFDVLDRKILLTKLQYYGIWGKVLDWLSNYLFERTYM